MKTLHAFCLKNPDLKDAEQLHSVLNGLEKHALEFQLWENSFESKPQASFTLAHNGRSVLVKFFVEEAEIRASVTKINGAVWEDSCVEFFVSFDETGYYNFEFNCIGTVLAAFRRNRNDRTLLPEDALKRIETYTTLNKKDDRFYWEMLIIIPIELFVRHSFQSLNGVECRANFYKCGDGLSRPHYLAWSKIIADNPDFHLPEFFGEVRFE